MDKPVVQHKIPASKYPFTVELIEYQTGEVLHTIKVPGPGVVQIPSCRPRIVRVRVTFADDEVIEQPPCIRCPRCGLVSYNHRDISEGYCGRCCDWTCD